MDVVKAMSLFNSEDLPGIFPHGIAQQFLVELKCGTFALLTTIHSSLDQSSHFQS